MTPALMLLGTHSNAGKSLMATAFCRIFSRKGYRVAPFKAQNMSNNAGVTPQGGEMGRAQIVQAEAAGIAPHTDMNPVLLKPQADHRSQIVLNGKVYGHLDAKNWRQIKTHLWIEVQAAYDRLSTQYDLIILEGAGSPAEINLKDADMVNLRMARHAKAPCLLVGDIDRGGVFAALAGTMLLLDPDERAQIKAFLINKFRGDPSLLGNALNDLQQKAFGVPTLGVVPYLHELNIADEDAVVLDQTPNPKESPQIDIAVIQLPHIANFDDFAPLQHDPHVQLRYVRSPHELRHPDAIILPGTKSTLSDLQWLRHQQLDHAIQTAHTNGTAIIGICGGYQMLGQTLTDPEGIEAPAGTTQQGLNLLAIDTRFTPQKQTHQARLRQSDGTELNGYEIHMGETTRHAHVQPFGTITLRGNQKVTIPDGAISPNKKVWGTYLHGLFANAAFRHQWLTQLGWQKQDQITTTQLPDYDRLADAVEAAIDNTFLMRIVNL